MKRRIVVFALKAAFYAVRNLIILVGLLIAFGFADRNVGTVHDWVRSTPQYRITVQSFDPNNILSGDVNQLDIQPVKVLANAGNLAYIYTARWVEGVIR